jgi:hypothetical protein
MSSSFLVRFCVCFPFPKNVKEVQSNRLLHLERKSIVAHKLLGSYTYFRSPLEQVKES